MEYLSLCQYLFVLSIWLQSMKEKIVEKARKLVGSVDVLNLITKRILISDIDVEVGCESFL
jgi:hypothetical protein